MDTNNENKALETKPQGYFFYGYVIVIAAFICYLCSSTVQYGGSMMAALLSKEFGWSATLLGLGTSAFSLFQGFAAPISAKLIRNPKFGTRWTFFIGALITAAVMFLMGFVVKNPYVYIFTYGVIGGAAWNMAGNPTVTAAVSYWWNKRRGMMIGIIMISGGLGGFFVVKMIRAAIAATGKNSSGYVIMGVALIISAFVALLLKHKPSDIDEVPDGKYSNVVLKPKKEVNYYRVGGKISPERIIKHPSIWIMALVGCSFFFGYSMFNTHSVLHMMNLGISRDTSANIFAIMPLIGIGGRLLCSLISDRVDPRYLWGLGILLFAVGYFGMTQVGPDKLYWAYIGAACVGLGWGMNMVMYGVMSGCWYGGENYAAGVAVTQPVKQVFNAISPTLAGIIVDSTGSYNIAFWIAIGICVVSFVLLQVIPKMKPDAEVGYVPKKAEE